MGLNTGILIVATGHWYFGNLAANLAATLKASSPDVPLQLCYEPSAVAKLNAEHLALFDVKNELVLGVDKITPKTQLWDLSVFENTLYLDADTAWSPHHNLGSAIDELMKRKTFTTLVYETLDLKSKNSKKHGERNRSYTYWFERDEIDRLKKFFGKETGAIYCHNTSLVWFKRTAENKRLFERIKSLYADENQFKALHWRSGKPDEFFYNIATWLEGVYDSHFHFEKILFPFVNTVRRETDYFRKFWAISNCCGETPSNIVETYHKWVRAACKKVGTEPFKHIDKKYLSQLP